MRITKKLLDGFDLRLTDDRKWASNGHWLVRDPKGLGTLLKKETSKRLTDRDVSAVIPKRITKYERIVSSNILQEVGVGLLARAYREVRMLGGGGVFMAEEYHQAFTNGYAECYWWGKGALEPILLTSNDALCSSEDLIALIMPIRLEPEFVHADLF